MGLVTTVRAKLDECNVIIFGDSKNSLANTLESKPKHKKKN
jgi:hypothetical protein